MKHSIYTIDKYGKYQYFHRFSDLKEFLRHYLLTFQKKYVLNMDRDNKRTSTRCMILKISYYIVTDKSQTIHTENIVVHKRSAYITTDRPLFGTLPYYD